MKIRNFPGRKLGVNKQIRFTQLLSELKREGVNVEGFLYNDREKALILPDHADEEVVKQVLNNHKPVTPGPRRRNQSFRSIMKALRQANTFEEFKNLVLQDGSGTSGGHS